MSNTFIASVVFLIIIIAISLYLAPLIRNIEGFKSGTFTRVEGDYPLSVNQAILDDRLGKIQEEIDVFYTKIQDSFVE